MWSMYYKGRFIMDVRLIDITEVLIKKSEVRYKSEDGLTVYLNLNSMECGYVKSVN
jgi:hypothetical protein